MTTIKKKHNLNLEEDEYFIALQKQFGNVVRYSYNRMTKDDMSFNEVEINVKANMNNIDHMDASWIKCAVKKAESLKKQKDEEQKLKDKKDKKNGIELCDKNKYKVIFGGKEEFFKRKYNKIKSFDNSMPINMRGSSRDPLGNRKANIINDTFYFKPCRGKEYEVKLHLSKNQKKMLYEIEQGCKEGTNYFTYEIDKQYVYITIEEPTLYKHDHKENRYLGIDLNPNYIGLSIMDIKGDVKKEVYKEIIDLKELNTITNTNKKKYELTGVNMHIMKLCKSYHVEYVSIEDLSMSTSDKGLGRNYNRLVNNTWIRNYLVNNLVKILNMHDIKSVIVPPHYSSFIGQMIYENDYDSVAASKEIAFRGYLKVLEKDIWTYINAYLGSEVTTRWKKMLPSSSTYKDLYNFFKKKKSKDSYRFLFNNIEKQRWSFFRLKSHKSKIDLVTF